jgi:hypothetical protein
MKALVLKEYKQFRVEDRPCSITGIVLLLCARPVVLPYRMDDGH